MSENTIFAKSDVARDIIQNSEYFTNAGMAVGEYVWNSLDYGKPGARVEVCVKVGRGKISVRDRRVVKYNGITIEETKNGGGMSFEELQRFFTMHAETQARREGRKVRGRYGTGKSAAFGIDKSLIVDTIKNGKRNVVRLQLCDLYPGMERVPVESLLTNQPIGEPDGTKIIIDNLKLKRVKVESIKKYLRRNVGRHLNNHDVIVDGEKLIYSPPEFEKEWSFPCPEEYRKEVGDCQLIIRLAKTELNEEDRGIAVLSNTYTYETIDLTRFGSSAYATRLFGEVDSPLLDSPDEIPAFDNTRSRLNKENARVHALLEWIEGRIKFVVKELQDEAKRQIERETLDKLNNSAVA